MWEQAPDANLRSWGSATRYCVEKNVGGTRGWRLPSVVELASLIDPSLPAPFVPASAFSNVQSAFYWSASSFADDPSRAWGVYFGGNGVGALSKPVNGLVWCVRGGMNADAY